MHPFIRSGLKGKIVKNIIINKLSNSFGLSSDIEKGLEAIGYKNALPVQSEVIPYILEGKDLIVQAKTGSGKTGAFGIPIVEKIDIEENLPQVLVLTPTRELAVQVCEEIARIGKYKKIRCLPVYGKQPIHIQLRQLKQRVHVIVGTPGRIADLIKKKNLCLERLKFLVIDEADELLKRGFLEEVEGIINRTPEDRNTLLFSATMPEKIESICSKYLKEPIRIELETEKEPIDQIKQTWYEVAEDWKFLLLTKLLDTWSPKSCMIFCNTRSKADHLTERLKNSKYDCIALHGGMPQKDRLRAISAFKNKQITYLVATDLAARGIHIDKLDLVINYGIPMDNENYVHRIGRTGRCGEDGVAISLVSEYDKKRWEEIQEYIEFKVPKEDKDAIIKNAPKVEKRQNKKRKSPEKAHKDITRIRLNAGKNRKMRAGDVLGAISNMNGIKAEDIGIIDILDTCTYVDIFNNKASIVLKEFENTKVKGKLIKAKKI